MTEAQDPFAFWQYYTPNEQMTVTPEEINEAEENLRGWMIGLTVLEAMSRLGHENVRELRIDGEDLYGTCDYDLTRINIATQDGIITEVLGIG